MSAEADAADARWASLQDRIEAQIDGLKRMNPVQVTALATFADLALEAAI